MPYPKARVFSPVYFQVLCSLATALDQPDMHGYYIASYTLTIPASEDEDADYDSSLSGNTPEHIVSHLAVSKIR